MFPERNLPWWRHDRPWGFRFSTMDAVIFAGGIAASVVLWRFIDFYALVIPFLLCHFFLFCNTFRLGGERDLIWTGTFLANMYCWQFSQNMVIHLIIQLLITTALIVQCVLGKNYHGFACTRINPERYRVGAMTEGAFTRRVLLACQLPKPLIEALTGRRLDEFET